MANAHQQISRFLQAMQEIYGPFESVSETDASTWTPPPMSEGHRGRYLWTDAFGVLNFLTIGALTATSVTSNKYHIFAARLIATVHDTLGRTRDGTSRLPRASEAHPLAGGLRIGKEGEESDPGGDGDGQYHHYLTIWMFALNRMSCATGERKYNDLAIELARAIHPCFMRDRESARPRMHWKMSIDLKRPLVQSEGNLDPIDGYVVFNLLQRTNGDDRSVLAKEISEYKKILDTKWKRYVSDDPLDLGMTVWTAHWFDGEEEWATQLTRKALDCLRSLLEEGLFDEPTQHRLAFREFGTCLGLRCHLESGSGSSGPKTEDRYWATATDNILSLWEHSLDNTSAVRESLRPITSVMHASALIPGVFRKGFLGRED